MGKVLVLLKKVPQLFKFLVKYGPVIYAIIEAGKLVQDKIEELETENSK